MKPHLLAVALPLFLVACDKEPSKPDSTKPTAAAGSSATTAPSSPVATSTSGPVTTGRKPLFRATGFQAPESVLYDYENDRYLVSNVNGKPWEADNNGYITVLGTDGRIVNEKWIEGGKDKVKLNAPKGSGIAKSVLYVADIDTVRSFDLKTGAPKGDFKIPGATFLNDVAANPIDNTVYVSDSGLKMGPKGDLVASGTDAVYVIEKGKVRTLAKGAELLNRPNGLVAGPTGVWIVTGESNELYRLDFKGKKQESLKLPKGQLDGIALFADSFFVSSWEAGAVFGGSLKLAFKVEVGGLKSPADIGIDTKRSILLVPLMLDNAVEAYEAR
jgi:hypothetical protein